MSEPAITPLPLTPVVGPMAWHATDYGADRNWAFRLCGPELEELERACAQVSALGLAFRDITPEHFVLPTLGPRLAGLRRDLRSGPGFALMKGIDVDRYTEQDLRRTFVGIASHLGITVSQSFRGDYLGDVKDYREPGNERPYRRGGVLDMHRDPCDVVGLLCYRQAMSGGLSRVCSAATVWNTVLAERPEFAPVLRDGYRLYITGDDRSGSSPVTPMRVPVFNADPDGLLHCSYIAELVNSAVVKGGEPWPEQGREALDYATSVMQREDVYLDMNIERGDIQFLNNRTTIHARTDYTDFPEPERCRLMFRVWLMCPEWPQPTPALNRVLFGGRTDRADGGVGKRAEPQTTTA